MRVTMCGQLKVRLHERMLPISCLTVVLLTLVLVRGSHTTRDKVSRQRLEDRYRIVLIPDSRQRSHDRPNIHSKLKDNIQELHDDNDKEIDEISNSLADIQESVSQDHQNERDMVHDLRIGALILRMASNFIGQKAELIHLHDSPHDVDHDSEPAWVSSPHGEPYLPADEEEGHGQAENEPNPIMDMEVDHFEEKTHHRFTHGVWLILLLAFTGAAALAGLVCVTSICGIEDIRRIKGSMKPKYSYIQWSPKRTRAPECHQSHPVSCEPPICATPPLDDCIKHVNTFKSTGVDPVQDLSQRLKRTTCRLDMLQRTAMAEKPCDLKPSPGVKKNPCVKFCDSRGASISCDSSSSDCSRFLESLPLSLFKSPIEPKGGAKRLRSDVNQSSSSDWMEIDLNVTLDDLER